MFLLSIILLLSAVIAVALTLRHYVTTIHRQNAEITKLRAYNKFFTHENDEHQSHNKSLAQQLEWYRNVFVESDNIVLVYAVTDDFLPGNIVDANDFACKALQRSREELIKMTPMQIAYDERAISTLGFSVADMLSLSSKNNKNSQAELKPVRGLTKRIIKREKLFFEMTCVAKSGKSFPVEIKANSIKINNTDFVIWSGRDISQQKAAEKSMREIELHLKNFLQYSPVGVAMYDGNQSLISVNIAFLVSMGIPDNRQFAAFDPFNSAFVPEQFRARIRHGENVRFDMKIDFNVVREKSMFISTRSDTGWFDVMIVNMGKDRDAKPRGYLVYFLDYTRRHKAELALQDSERLLRQAEKMEAIGALASGIAHDFNNILTPIIGYAQLTLDICEDDEQLRSFVGEIMKAGGRAKELVDQILTFSRDKGRDGQPIDIMLIVKEVLKLMRASMPDSIEVKTLFRAKQSVVIADPTQMHQVIMNLCTNAWHAMKEMESGSLEIRTSEFMHEQDKKGRMRQLPSGRYLQLSVCDTGTGMDQNTIDHMFDPFFTTKKSGEGTGMGMSVVRNIVVSFKGAILVDSEPDKGTEIHVVLPLAEVASNESAQVETVQFESESGTALVADDDHWSRDIVDRMLKKMGYQVFTVNNGLDALELYKESPDKFDIVFTDEQMPGLLGSDLAREITAIRPGIPVVLLTGFSQSLSPDQARAAGIAAYLRKPFVMPDLAKVLQKVRAEAG